MSEQVENITLDDATTEIPMNQEAAEPQGTQLEEVLAVDEPSPTEEQTEKKEPGYVKRRIESAVQKDRETYTEKIRAEIRSEYDKIIQPLLEERMERQADQLVSEGEFKSKDRALEYLRLKNGQKPLEQIVEPVQEEANPAQARAEMLVAQAKSIKATSNIDMMELLKTDPAIRRRVLSGESDFADIIPELLGKKAPPSPVRAPNNAVPQRRTPMELSSDELKRLDENLAKGTRVDMRR